MSATVDDRVLQMRFDNKQFEENIQTSISSLNKLDKSLNLTGATKGLENVDAAAKSVNMTGLSSAVETVSAKFSALQVMAVTALANITNSAVNAGRRIVSSLTIEPVTTGFSEYELKMNSVQTIMSGTGESLKTVNKYLEELNAYSDRTIYSFSDMTSNIGKFTNAGVKLEDAVTAIKGVSNVAALSGANAAEASRAMYNFSQALSSGYVKLIDWKSIENANMATVGFKEELIKTALAMGTITDAGDGMYKTLEGNAFNATKNFNEVFQDQWMTTEVLVDTLKKYTDESTDLGKKAYAAAQDVKTFTQMLDTLKESAQSGWAQSWEIITGDFDEAKKLWTDVNNVIGEMIGESAKGRNDLLQGWKDLGGRAAAIDAISNAFHGVMDVLKPIKEGFREIFPPTTAKQLFEITKRIKDLTEKFKISDETADKIKRTFKGVFALLDIGVEAVKAIAKGFGSLIKFIAPASGGLLDFTANLGDGIVAFRDFIKSGDVFNKIIKTIVDAFKKVVTGIKQFVTNISEALSEFVNVDMSAVDGFTEALQKRFEPLSAFGEGVRKVFGFIGTVIKKVAPIFITLAGLIGKALDKLFGKLTEAIKSTDINTVMDLLNAFMASGIIVGIKKMISQLGSFKDTADGFIGKITAIFDGVRGSLEAFQSSLKSKTLIKIAASIAILAAALLVLSLIDSDKLTLALTAMTTMFLELFGSMAAFEKIMGSSGFASIPKVTAAMIGISAAILILSAAMTTISKLDWGGMAKGLGGIAVICATLVAFTKTVKNSAAFATTASALLTFSIGILIFSKAVERMGSLDTGSLARGLSGIAVICAALILFTKNVKNSAAFATTASALTGFSIGMLIFAQAVKSMGSLDTASLIKGLVGVGALLAGIIVFTKLVSNPAELASTASAILVISVAMAILGKALTTMGGMTWEEMARGLITLAASLAIIAGAMYLMTSGIAGAAAMLVFAGAMAILAPVLSLMAVLPMDKIVGGLLSLAGALAVFSVVGLLAPLLMLMSVGLGMFGKACLSAGQGIVALAAAFGVLTILGGSLLEFVGILALFSVLAVLSPLLMLAAAGIGLFGLACMAAGVGISLLATGLTALSVSASVGAVALVTVVTTILSLIPYACEQVGVGVVTLVKTVASMATSLVDAIAEIFTAIIQALTKCIPPLMELIGAFLDGLIDLIATYVPKIIALGMDLIIGFLSGIAKKIPDIIAAGISIITNFLIALGREIPKIADAAFKMIIEFIDGLNRAIKDNYQKMKDAIENLLNTVSDCLSDLGGTVKKIGSNILDGIVQGMKDAVRNIGSSIKEIGQDIKDGFCDFFGINSPSKVFMGYGKNLDQGLAIGLVDNVRYISKAMKDVNKATNNSFSDVISNISDSMSEDMDMNPTIRPVIDLSDVKAGEKQLTGMLNKNKTISVDTANISTAAISHGMSSKSNINSASSKSSSQPTSISFTQNNYSPKSLDKVDIYRQTKNQLSSVKGVLNAR